METAVTDAHVFTLATRLNGDVNVDPFAGLATEMVEVAVVEVAETILIFKSTWAFTFFPQHFT